MIKFVLVRHGESIWNLKNKFTGWTDVDLSTNGIKEAVSAGKALKAAGYTFDIAYTSVLKRANRTLDLILTELGEEIPVYYSWKLNERHYGALQGLNKQETAEKYGADQVKLWRRSLNTRPPKLEMDDPRHPSNDSLYALLSKEELPACENLLDTLKRVLEYWNSDILPSIHEDKKVLIVAHGNSLRALIKFLDNISDDDIMGLEVPTGKALVYEYDEVLDKALRHYYI